MSEEPGSFDAVLAILVAGQQRGPLKASELARLLGELSTEPALRRALSLGYLRDEGGRFALTQSGRDQMDRWLIEIQKQLTPDSPHLERRFRQEDPSLPLAANTIWAEAFCINIRVAPEALRPLVPSVFALDLYEGSAFVSLTVSRLKDFGAGSLPRMMRMNFYQSTYRAHVVFHDFLGRPRRGCYFVRSETNSRVMSLVANLLPEFRAHRCSTCPIVMAQRDHQIVLSVDSSPDPAGKVVLVVDTTRRLDSMPEGSLFSSKKDAYEYIVDFYDAFSFEPKTREVYILGIERGEWDIQILEPVDHYLGYIHDGPFPQGAAQVDSVFYFRDTPYQWLPLVKEKVVLPPSEG